MFSVVKRTGEKSSAIFISFFKIRFFGRWKKMFDRNFLFFFLMEKVNAIIYRWMPSIEWKNCHRVERIDKTLSIQHISSSQTKGQNSSFAKENSFSFIFWSVHGSLSATIIFHIHHLAAKKWKEIQLTNNEVNLSLIRHDSFSSSPIKWKHESTSFIVIYNSNQPYPNHKNGPPKNDREEQTKICACQINTSDNCVSNWRSTGMLFSQWTNDDLNNNGTNVCARLHLTQLKPEFEKDRIKREMILIRMNTSLVLVAHTRTEPIKMCWNTSVNALWPIVFISDYSMRYLYATIQNKLPNGLELQLQKHSMRTRFFSSSFFLGVHWIVGQKEQRVK